MIAQWENECISLPVPSMARVMIAQWENECISLSVLPVTRVRYPAMAEYFKDFLPWLITLNQPALCQCDRKWLNLPLVAPHRGERLKSKKSGKLEKKKRLLL